MGSNGTGFPVGSTEHQFVIDAINHWNANTVVELVPRSNEENFAVFVTAQSVCSSPVGMVGGRQEVRCDLSSGGFSQVSIIHEIGHTVGFWHEHSREDRSRNVTVNFNNIQSENAHNFRQHIDDGDDIGPYDFDSIMHYGPMAFAIDPSQNTIVAPQPIGAARGLSSGDVAAVRLFFRWRNLGGQFADAPTAVTWGPGRLDIFGRGNDGRIYHKAWADDQWWPSSDLSNWENLGGQFSGPPIAVCWQANRLDVFGRGNDGSVYHKAWANGQWWPSSDPSDWENLGGQFANPPTAVTWGPGRLDIFGRGNDGQIYHKTWENEWWPS